MDISIEDYVLIKNTLGYIINENEVLLQNIIDGQIVKLSRKEVEPFFTSEDLEREQCLFYEKYLIQKQDFFERRDEKYLEREDRKEKSRSKVNEEKRERHKERMELLTVIAENIPKNRKD